VVLVIVAASLLAQDAVPVKAEDDALLVDAVLSWLPTDAETIVAARGFKLPVKAVPEKPPVSEVDFVVSVLRALATGPIAYMKKGAYADELRRLPIVLAVGAGREFDVTSKFGELRYQGCHILIFKDPLEPILTDFDARLRKDCKDSYKIDGVEAFVFDDVVFTKESWTKKKEWETLLIARPEKNILLCATQEDFLKEVLRRLWSKTPGRAVSNDLPIWKYIDRASPAWMVRHGGKSLDEIAHGPDLAMSVHAEAPAALRVVYLADGPKARQAALHAAQKCWVRDGSDDGLLQKLKPSIQQDESGATTVSISLDANAQETLPDKMGALVFLIPSLRSTRFEE
jgi:hypothetical protein